MEDIENLIVVWVGPAPEEFQSAFIIKKQFNSFHSYECKDYLKSLRKNDRVFFVLTSADDTDINRLINYSQIIAFYLFQTKLNVQHIKFRGTFVDVKSLFDKIHHDIRSFYRNFSAPWNVFDWSTPQASLNELSVDNVSFVWGQILLDILYKLPNSDDEQAKEEWLAECRRAYSNDLKEIERINKFEREYCFDDATIWYTNTGFAYRLLNQALRTKNIDIIYKCRFMLRQMYQQLVKIQEDQKKDDLSVETVYRGQEITEKELEKLRQNEGQLISTNAFLSTSIDSQVADIYLNTDALSSDHKYWIKFTITIDPEVSLPYVFAYIGLKDFTTKTDEMEVLFAPGAVFRTETIPVNNGSKSRMWEMRLRLARNDQCLEVNRFMEAIRKKNSRYSNSLFTLASTLAEMNQTSSALLFYRIFIQQSNSNSGLPEYDLTALFSDIGSLFFEIGNYYEAIRFYEKVYNLIRKYYPCDVVCFVRVCSHMGSTYIELGNYERARSFYNQALIYVNCFPNQHCDIHAHLYSNMGRLEYYEKKFDSSLEFYKKAIRIIENYLPTEYKYLIAVRLNMASVYQECQNYDRAIELYKKIIELCEKTLLTEDTLLVKTYSNMSLCYSNQKKFVDAEHYIQMSIKLAYAQTPLNHDIVATCHNVYAVYYMSKEQYEEALEHGDSSLEHAKQLGLTNDHLSMRTYQELLKNCRDKLKNV